MTPPPSLHLNIFAVPPPAVVAELRSCARVLEEAGEAPFLKAGMVPHITLFLFRTASHEAVQARLANVFANVAAFGVSAEGLRRAGPWLFLDLKPTAELASLNRQLASILGPLRDASAPVPAFIAGVPDPDVQSRLRASFAEFGYPRTGPLYRPHCSLTSTLSHGFDLTRLAAGSPSGIVREAGIGLANDDGQVFDVVARFPLQPGGAT